MAVLQAAPGGQLNIVVLNKALFYADLLALRDLGHTITRQDYVALPQGPVVDSYKTTIIAALQSAGWAEQMQTVSMAKPLRVLRPLETFDKLNGSETNIATVMGQSFTNFTSTLVSSYSHANPGWIAARREVTSMRPAPKINMRLALQQLVDDEEDDEWMSEPLNADDHAVCETADSANSPWM